MPRHEFGVMEAFEEKRWYMEYEPKKYDCVSVDDDRLLEAMNDAPEDWNAVASYACISTQPICGLEYTGVTLIPPASLPALERAVKNAAEKYPSPEWDGLLRKIGDAARAGKHLIHFGI